MLYQNNIQIRTIIKLISKFRQKYGTLVKPVTKVVFPVVSSYNYFRFLATSFTSALGYRIHFIVIKNRLILLLADNNVISIFTRHFRIHTIKVFICQENKYEQIFY